MHARAGRCVVIRPRPHDYDELDEAYHILPAMPRADFREGIRADQKRQRPESRRQKAFNCSRTE